MTIRIADFEKRLDALERWPKEATLGILEHRVRQLQDQVRESHIVMGSMAREIEALRTYIQRRDEGLRQADRHAMIAGDRDGGEQPQDGEQAAWTVGATDGDKQPDVGDDFPTLAAMQSEAMDTVNVPKDGSGDMNTSVRRSTHDEVNVQVGEAPTSSRERRPSV